MRDIYLFKNTKMTCLLINNLRSSPSSVLWLPLHFTKYFSNTLTATWYFIRLRHHNFLGNPQLMAPRSFPFFGDYKRRHDEHPGG